MESTGIFSVASARRRIDEICLPNIGEETRWVKCVPIKINVLAWKIKTDALPTRFNISRRGIDIQDMSCPICDNAIESTDHLFFRCGLVRDIANKVLSWWNLDHANLNSYAEWKSWLVSIRMDSKLKKMFEGVWYSIWWYVWIYRNKLLFDERKPSKSMLIDNVIASSFYWCQTTKLKQIEREAATRLDVSYCQKRNEDLKLLALDTTGVNSVDVWSGRTSAVDRRTTTATPPILRRTFTIVSTCLSHVKRLVSLGRIGSTLSEGDLKCGIALRRYSDDGKVDSTDTSEEDIEGAFVQRRYPGNIKELLSLFCSSDSDSVDASTTLLGVNDPALPASEVILLVEVLFVLYMIMLGYLNWGPTNYSPRQKYTILFWVSIGMLIYAGIAVIGVLEMHKIGGDWKRRASFFSYTIYLAAIVGFAVLIVLVSFH
ncbi:RNA-directed DNA polymerase, eukaryota [Tanacetum coccineum]